MEAIRVLADLGGYKELRFTKRHEMFFSGASANARVPIYPSRRMVCN